MNTRRPQLYRLASPFSPENTAESDSTGWPERAVAGAAVTVDRAGGVVRPSCEATVYEPDLCGHRIVARSADGRIAFAFGGYGRGPSQFNMPLDVVTIWPRFWGERDLNSEPASARPAPWLAVADYGNHRVQFFECDGAYVGETALAAHEAPCQLAWRAPALGIITVDGGTLRVNVAASLVSATRTQRRRGPDTSKPATPRTLRVC
jgi:hypothetical protein